MNLVGSISGGETSAFMIRKLLDSDLSRYESLSFVFANTGQENEETLIFIDRISQYFGIKIVWLEAKVNHGIRKTSDYMVVDFKSANRSGSVFEDVIKKYGIPNPAYLHCTRDLKNEPIKQWCVDNFGKDYEIAIGIRLDEKEREPKNNIYRTVYPLINMGITKHDVIEYWKKQPFRLNIENYQGNCKWCYKKSDRKLMLIAYENRDCFDFPLLMERLHGLAGSNDDGTKRVFFRNNRSAKDILNMTDELISDKRVYEYERKRIIDDYNNSIFEGGCSESCEPFVQQPLF